MSIDISQGGSKPHMDSADDNATEDLQVVKVGGDGQISYLDISRLEEHLNCVPDKANALETIIIDISIIIEQEECFKEWTSEIHDLIARKGYWEGGKYSTFKAWLAGHPAFFDSAKQGRFIRNRRKAAINSLVSNGVSGPRFEYMISHFSRTFVEAVRKQVDMHGFSYPLVCALANIKAYHRLKAGKRGSKGAHTQTIDIVDLDTITYRRLSQVELKLVKAKVGSHGFLVEAGTEDKVILDKDFDTATESFVVGHGGFQQPEEYGRTQPKITADGSSQEDEADKDKRSTKRAKPQRKPDTFDIRKFLYISECTCPEDVPQFLTVNLDNLTPTCGYAAVSSLLPNVLESSDKLCPRHCQITLVRALGRNHLVDRTNHKTLQAEIRELVPKLEKCVLDDASLKSKFDSYKESIGFSWDAVEAVAVPQHTGSHRDDPLHSGKNKRKRIGQ